MLGGLLPFAFANPELVVFGDRSLSAALLAPGLKQADFARLGAALWTLETVMPTVSSSERANPEASFTVGTS